MPIIDATDNWTWANSWILQLSYIAFSYPLISSDTLERHVTVNLPATVGHRKRVVRQIRAHSKYDKIKEQLAERVPDWDLDQRLVDVTIRRKK